MIGGNNFPNHHISNKAVASLLPRVEVEDEERCPAIMCSAIVREGEAAIGIGQIETCQELDRLERNTSSPAF